MKILKRFMMGVGGVAMLAVLLQLTAPRAVHAVVSALVTVANTSSNPVPTVAQDNPARATVVFTNCAASTGSAGDFNCVAGTLPSFLSGESQDQFPYMVPPGERLAIEEVEASCAGPNGGSVAGANLSFTESGMTAAHPLVLTPQGVDANGSSEFTLNQMVRYYADAGSTVKFDALATLPGGAGSGLGAGKTSTTTCTWGLNGYLINYP